MNDGIDGVFAGCERSFHDCVPREDECRRPGLRASVGYLRKILARSTPVPREIGRNFVGGIEAD
jgi:hypothetical protein